MVTTFLEEQIVRISVFRGCKILIERVVLKENLISLEIWDFDINLGMDWFPRLEFECDHRVLPTYVISALEAKRLLYKGCEVYLTHVIDTSTLEVTLESALVVQEFLDVFPEDLPKLSLDRKPEFGIDFFVWISPHFYTTVLDGPSWAK